MLSDELPPVRCIVGNVGQLSAGLGLLIDNRRDHLFYSTPS